MSCNYLPASPSWYCSRVSDCDDRGIYVFGGKRSLFLFDVSVNPPQNIGHVAAHSERVVGVSLKKHDGSPVTCCTAGEDRKIKVWDLDNRTLLFEHEEHKHNPTTVHWSECDANAIASGDERGTVIVWTLSSNGITNLTPVTAENGHIYCLAWSPHTANHLAVGYKSGMLVVLDVEKGGSILQRLRGHDEEIHCVTWCPVVGEEIQATTDDGDAESQLNWRCRVEKTAPNYGTGFLLASSSRDRTIRVWSMERGKSVITLKLPVNTGFRRNRYDDQSKTRLWLTLNWPKNRPREILSSSHAGEVLLWDLCCPGQKKWEMLSSNADVKGHHRIIFNITVGGPANNMACTIGMDRQVVMWNLDEMSASCSLSSLGGFVYALAVSPSNPGHMALGVGDNLLRVWNYANPTNPYECSTFWQGIKSKVTSLCWHPCKEGQLAYGTDDGRVGIYNVLSTKLPVISSTYHRRTVYVVTWGPRCHASEEGEANASSASYVLYSCGDGVILLHDPQNLEADAVNFNDLLTKSAGGSQRFPIRSEISWKPDYSVLAVGNDDGSVEIYQPSGLKLLCSVRVQMKLVNCVRWHPEHTADVSQAASTQYWIAIGSNDSNIHVVNLHKVLDGGQDVTESIVINESYRKLEGHSNRITALAWSMHAEGQLVSASFDNTAQVWNVKTGQPVANYRGHSGRLLAVQWSAFNPDIIYTGSEDFTVQAWSISAQKDKDPPVRDKKKRTKNKKAQAKDSSRQSPQADGRTDTASGDGSKVSRNGDREVTKLQKMLEERKQEILAKQQQNSANDDEAELEARAKTDGEIKTDNLDGKQVGEDVSFTVGGDTRKTIVVTSPTKNDEAKKVPGRDRKKRRTNRSLLPNVSSYENRGKQPLHEDCVDLAMLLNRQERQVEDANKSGQLTEEKWHLGLYTSRRDTYKIIKKERAHHSEQDNSEQEMLLDVWTGDVSKTLLDAGEKGILNDWMMSLAPMASPARWRHLCGLYAAQLEKEGSPHKAASYLIAAGDIAEALALLQRNKLFRDAMCLAQLRLSPHDPALTELWLAWADSLIRDGNQEQAAKCYLAVKQPLQAAKTLTKRSDLSSLRTAAHVMLIASEKDACKVYGLQYISECQRRHDWLSASQVIQWDPMFTPVGLYITLHEIFVRELVKLGLFEPSQDEQLQFAVYPENTANKFPKFLLDESRRGLCVPWKPHLVEDELFIHHIIRLWKVWHELELEQDSLKQTYTAVHTIWETKQQSTDVKQMLCELALDLTLGLLSLLRGDLNMTTYWWAVAMATCHTSGHVGIMEGICRLVLPLGPTKLPQLQQEVTAIRLDMATDARGTGPVKSPFPSPRPSSADLTIRLNVVNDSKYCTSYDCLSAFYYHCVVLYYVNADNPPDVTASTPAALDSLNMNTATTDSPSPGTEDSKNNDLDPGNDELESKQFAQNETSCNGVSDSLNDAALLQSVDSQQSLASMEGSLDSVQLSSFDVVSPDIDKLPVESPDDADKNIEVSINDAANMYVTSGDQCDSDNLNKEGQVTEVHTDSEFDNQCRQIGEIMDNASKKICRSDSVANMRISQDDMAGLAGNLLWTSQARKNQLYAALDAIKHAVAALKHQNQLSGHVGEIHVKMVDELLLSPPTMARTLSGDYLHMKPLPESPAKQKLLREHASPSRIVEDKESEWVEMRDPDLQTNGTHSLSNGDNLTSHEQVRSSDPTHSSVVDIAHHIGSSDGGQQMADSTISMASSMTQSTVIQTQIYAKARSIFSGMDASICDPAGLQSSCIKSETTTDCVPNGHNPPVNGEPSKQPEDSPASTGDSVDKVGSALQNGHSRDAATTAVVDDQNNDTSRADTESLPANWAELPIDVRYLHESMTLHRLAKEQAQLTAQLHDVACQMQNCPFPDPLTSAKNLLSLAKQIDMEDEFTSTLANWSLQHSYTTDHHEFFKNTLHELTCQIHVPN